MFHRSKSVGLVVAIAALARFSFGDGPTTAPVAFPMTRVVHEAVVASYLEEPREIERHVDTLTSYDLQLRSHGVPPSGCADDMAWLWAVSLPTPELRAQGYEHVAARPLDESVSIAIRAALGQQLTEQIEATRKQDRWNRWADVFNSATRNLGRLASGQIRGGVKFVVDLAFAGREFKRATDRTRKEWWLIEQYLRRFPDGPEAHPLRARQAALEATLDEYEIERLMQAAEFYADREWWDVALDYIRMAEKEGYSDRDRFRSQVKTAVGREMRRRERSLAVADTERFLQHDEQKKAYADLLAALGAGDWRDLRREGARAGKALVGTPLEDEAEDAMSVLFEWTGDRRQALAVQQDLALRFPETQTGLAARARLEDPEYNPRAGYELAVDEFRARQWRYVLTGDRTTRQNVDLATEFATPSVIELGWVGAFFVTDVAIRSVLVSFNRAVPPDELLEAGEELLADPRNLLTPEEESAIRVEMGILYEKLRRYDEATEVYREARILSPELDTRLTERAADELYRRILQREEPAHQVLLLERLIATHSDTDAAERARLQLERVRTESKIDFVIPHDWLEQDPQHWIRLGAAIPPALIDGSRLNGELNENGLVFWREATGAATYVSQDGRTTGSVPLTPETHADLRAAAEQWVDVNYAMDAGERSVFSQRLPFQLHGSVGGAGLLVYPTLKRAPLSDTEERRFY